MVSSLTEFRQTAENIGIICVSQTIPTACPINGDSYSVISSNGGTISPPYRPVNTNIDDEMLTIMRGFPQSSLEPPTSLLLFPDNPQ
jgi:hypothetical protein